MGKISGRPPQNKDVTNHAMVTEDSLVGFGGLNLITVKDG